MNRFKSRRKKEKRAIRSLRRLVFPTESMSVSLDENTAQPEVRTAMSGPHSDSRLRTALNSTLRNRTTNTTRTALSISSAATCSKGPSFEEMISSFVSVTFSYLLFGFSLYVDSIVNLFHVCYFSYRNPAVSKDLIKTAFHLLKTSYDNKLLTPTEIYQTTNHSIIKPMARQNIQYHSEESTAQLKTMRTTSEPRQ